MSPELSKGFKWIICLLLGFVSEHRSTICHLRIIAFILSLYIVFLTTLPCKDGGKGHCEIISQSDKSDAGHEGADRCSPFCVCDCCSTVVTTHAVTVISAPSFILEIEHVVPMTNSASCYFQHIWQPPKLS